MSRRIQYIIQFVYDHKYPSKKDILKFLEDKDLIISSRTLERDIERIRTDLGLEIAYTKTYDGYYIDEEKSVKVDSFFKFLEIVGLADILSKSLMDSNKILDHVSFDGSKYFKGIENLKDILTAISQKRKIHFIHENFGMQTFKEYIISPLLLKEYENRWYVVGVPDGIKEIRTFGIDRLTEVTVGKLTKLKKRTFKEQLESFDNIIGLNFESKDPVNIKLLVGELHIKYMESLPIHHSQITGSKNKNGQYTVDLFLVPNYEFKMQILKMGEHVEVIYPEVLRHKISGTLKRTLKKYD